MSPTAVATSPNPANTSSLNPRAVLDLILKDQLELRAELRTQQATMTKSLRRIERTLGLDAPSPPLGYADTSSRQPPDPMDRERRHSSSAQPKGAAVQRPTAGPVPSNIIQRLSCSVSNRVAPEPREEPQEGAPAEAKDQVDVIEVAQ